ncbi:hypothetical protein EON83_08220 [bacterium]|nr:MAG: hypothetical protein EON83_08220 [bacterium]
MAIWHNGNLSETASVDASGAGLLLGWGVFTTLGIKAGRALWLDQHLHRLRRDAARCDVTIPFSDTELHDAVSAVIGVNHISDGLARLTATRRDDGRWNTAPASDVTILALQSSPVKMRGLKVGFATAPFQGELSGVKTTSYLPYFWSWQQAHKQGFDEVVLLHNDLIVEAARSSIFWAKAGVLYTSPLSLGALDGIGRALAIKWAQEQGIEFRTAEVPLTALQNCDEAFVISAATGPRAIATLSTLDGETALPESQPIFESSRAWWDAQ